MNAPAIEASGLTIEYKAGRTRKTAVDGLSFRVERGEIVGFIGPNGAGKTSDIKALLDFTPVSRGMCSISGIPSCDPRARGNLGYMPEISYYPKYLTLSEFLQTCAAVSGVPSKLRREAVISVATRVGMESHLGARLAGFSKGMLQQAGFAQALVHDPDILILDEPMSGLDPIARMRMRHLLAELRDEGKTILFSSHELSEIEMVADRILLMDKGRLISQGAISEVVGASDNLEQAFLRLLEEELPWAA
ncbi:MAG: ABC transporter ATP-binding protein [Armatimonadetes bacterium]|nr:ABC transporter ATP-binding protein [Armatimonadota bacterium]